MLCDLEAARAEVVLLRIALRNPLVATKGRDVLTRHPGDVDDVLSRHPNAPNMQVVRRVDDVSSPIGTIVRILVWKELRHTFQSGLSVERAHRSSPKISSSVTSVPFGLSRFTRGTILHRAVPAAMRAKAARKYQKAMVPVVASIPAPDPAIAGAATLLYITRLSFCL